MDFSPLRVSATPTFSLEFFPPKDEEGESRLWDSLARFVPLNPDFVSVTYGAGGSTRDRTIRITSEITKRTSLPTVAHLTCVGSSRSEIGAVLDRYKESGIRAILALRGDPSGGPRAEWIPTAEGLNHADELVEMAASRGFTVGVAAFPDGHPASAGDFAKDVDVLCRKFELGAEFATTQFFFEIESYRRLVEALHLRGWTRPIVAGILPITNVRQLIRMAELGGTPLPKRITDRIMRYEGDSESVRQEGIEIAIELANALLEERVPGLHFYTMNSAESTLAIVEGIGLR